MMVWSFIISIIITYKHILNLQHTHIHTITLKPLHTCVVILNKRSHIVPLGKMSNICDVVTLVKRAFVNDHCAQFVHVQLRASCKIIIQEGLIKAALKRCIRVNEQHKKTEIIFLYVQTSISAWHARQLLRRQERAQIEQKLCSLLYRVLFF